MPTSRLMRVLRRTRLLGIALLLVACASDDPGPLFEAGAGTLLSITVDPEDPTVALESSLQLRALGHYDDGSIRDITHRVSWSSGDALVAEVDDALNKGLVTGRWCGKLSITVRLDTIPGETLVTVESALANASLLSLSPVNGRYFLNAQGEHVLLTGSHTWLTLQDIGATNPPPAFGYEAYLDSLESWNHNFFRLWMTENSRWALNIDSDDIWISPLPYARTGPGVALDGLARFDLSQWDDEYFTRMRDRVGEANQRGFYVAVMLFNGWSVVKEKLGTNARNPWLSHPFHRDNNINGIDGDPGDNDSGEEIQLLQIPAVTALQEAYVHRVIDTIGHLPNVVFEISNESDGDATAWQEHMVQVIRDYESTRPLQHMVGITVEWPGGTNEELLAGPADWISPGYDVSEFPDTDGSKVIIADTDHICGICGSQEWVWKTFMQGMNPVFMDLYDELANILDPGDPFEDRWFAVRYSMGYVLALSSRLDLGTTLPRAGLSSTGYCLARTDAPTSIYLSYSESGSSIDMDLRESEGSFSVEWLDPDTGFYTMEGSVEGGDWLTFDVPWIGDAVLILEQP